MRYYARTPSRTRTCRLWAATPRKRPLSSITRTYRSSTWTFISPHHPNSTQTTTTSSSYCAHPTRTSNPSNLGPTRSYPSTYTTGSYWSVHSRPQWRLSNCGLNSILSCTCSSGDDEGSHWSSWDTHDDLYAMVSGNTTPTTWSWC